MDSNPSSLFKRRFFFAEFPGEVKGMRRKSLLLILALVLTAGVFSGCSTEDDDDNPLGPATISDQRGSLIISVGSGSRPEISWTGGGVAALVVAKGNLQDILAGMRELIWAISNPGASWTGDIDLGQDTIFSPVTYGTSPGGAVDLTTVYGAYEDLQSGQRYSVAVFKEDWDYTETDSSNYGIATFTR